MVSFVRRWDLNASNRTDVRGDSLLNVLAFTVTDQPLGSVHCSQVNNVMNTSKRMLNGPQTPVCGSRDNGKLTLSTPVRVALRA
jgi:hypothetical protein